VCSQCVSVLMIAIIYQFNSVVGFSDDISSSYCTAVCRLYHAVCSYKVYSPRSVELITSCLTSMSYYGGQLTEQKIPCSRVEASFTHQTWHTESNNSDLFRRLTSLVHVFLHFIVNITKYRMLGLKSVDVEANKRLNTSKNGDSLSNALVCPKWYII